MRAGRTMGVAELDSRLEAIATENNLTGGQRDIFMLVKPFNLFIGEQKGDGIRESVARIHEDLEADPVLGIALDLRGELQEAGLGDGIGVDLDALMESAEGESPGVRYAVAVSALRFAYQAGVNEPEAPLFEPNQVTILFDQEQLDPGRSEIQSLVGQGVLLSVEASRESLGASQSPTAVWMFTPAQLDSLGLGDYAEGHRKVPAQMIRSRGVPVDARVENVVIIPIPKRFRTFGIPSALPLIHAAYRYAIAPLGETPANVEQYLRFIQDAVASGTIVPVVPVKEEIERALEILRQAA